MKYATYSTQAHEASIRTRRFALITLLVVFVFGLDRISQGSIRTPLAHTATATQAFVGGIADVILDNGFFSSRLRLSAENDALRDELQHLRSVAASGAALRDQNAALAQLTHLSQVRPGITTTVSSRESTFGTFYIAAGERDGVGNGDIVRTSDGYAVATIIETQQTSALCRSVFAPGTSIEVFAGTERIELMGKGAGNARGVAVRGSTIAEGSAVTAPSLLGYPVGVVGHTEGGAAEAAVDVYVRTPISIDSTQFVYVERP